MFTFVSFINAFISLLFGLFVFYNKPKSLKRLMYLLLSLSMALHFVFLPLSIYTADYSFSVLNVKLVHVCSTLIASFGFIFFNQMLFKKHFIRIKIAITLASSIFVTWAIFNKPVIKGVEPVGILPNWTVPGDEFFIYLIHYAFFTFTSFGLLIWQRKKTNPITKKRIDLILIGGFIAWLGGWTAFLPGWGVKIEPYGMFLISFFQLMIGYSILKYQAFDIKLTLTKFTSIVVTSLISFSTATIAV